MRRALVLVALLAAGCFTHAPAVAPPSSGALAFDPPTLVGKAASPSFDISETSLAIGADGTMLACAVDTMDAFASLDGGASWAATMPVAGRSNGDCDVAVLTGGTWVAAWATGGAMVIARSTDHGASWTTRTATGLPQQCFGVSTAVANYPYTTCPAHRPWLHASGAGLDIIYYDIQPTVVLFQRSTDGGATWGQPVIVASDPGFGTVGRPVVSEDGVKLRVPALFPIDPTGRSPARLVVASSDDGGASWRTRDAATLPDRFGIPALASSNGTLYLGTALASGSAEDVVVLTSRDDGVSWSAPHVLAAGVDPGKGYGKISLDVGPRGVIAGWYHLDASRGSVMTLAGLTDQGDVAWRADSAPLGGRDQFVEFVTMTHDASGTVHIVVPVASDACKTGTAADCLEHLVAR